MQTVIPESTISNEIEMLSSEFAALGANPHRACATWMGKQNTFTGQIMHSPNEVLLFLQASVAAMKPEPEQVPTEAQGPAQAEAPAPRAHTQHRIALSAWEQECAHANAAWREAVKQRKEAIAQWDAYVQQRHSVFADARARKPKLINA